MKKKLIQANPISLQKIKNNQDITHRRPSVPREQPVRQPQRKLYIWTDEKGYKVYSNKGCPNDGKTTSCEIKYY